MRQHASITLNSRDHLSRFQRRALIGACTIVISILAIRASGWSAHEVIVPSPTAPNNAASIPVSSQDKSAERVEVELITINARGFEPTEITRPKGRFVLAVRNKSGVAELALQLARENGNALHSARLPRGKRFWGNSLDLSPGAYLITEANHPDWIGRITITNK